jgi:hypothetical protein
VSPISKIFTRRVPVIECNGYSHIQKDWTAPTNKYINEKSLGARKLQGLIKIAIISAIHNSYQKKISHDIETNLMSEKTLFFQLVYLTAFMEGHNKHRNQC